MKPRSRKLLHSSAGMVGVLIAGVLASAPASTYRGPDFQIQARLGAPSISLGELDGDSRYTFAKIGGVKLGKDVIVVADGGSAELRFYDLRGRFQHSSGRKGSGPGEHISVKLVPNWYSDSLVVFDQAARRVSFLDARGKFGRTVQLPTSQREPGLVGTLDVLGVDRSGRIITVTQAALQPRKTGLQRRQAVLAYVPRVRANGVRLGTFSGSELVYRVVGGSGIFSRLPFLQDFTASIAAEKLYFVEGPSSILKERNLHTGATRQVPLPFENRRVSRDDYGRWFERELLTIPAERRADTRQYYRSMYDAWTMRPAAKVLIDDSGRVWVEEFTFGGNRRVAIYSADMRFLATVLLPANFSIVSVRGSNVAGVVTDSNGVERVEVRPLLGM